MRTATTVLLVVLLAGCSRGGGEAAETDARTTAPERIVFASKRDGDFEIYSMRPDGSELRQLTRNEAHGRFEADDAEPAWSPDGRRIVFTSSRDHPGDGQESWELYVMNADGSEQRRLTDNGGADLSPAWTSDGRLVYLACTNAWRCRAVTASADDGAEPAPIGNIPEFTHGVALSPDGRTLLYSVTRGVEVDVVTEDVASGRRRTLTRTRGLDGGGVWSPDGRRILFGSERDRNGDCLFHDCFGHASELYVMNADGTHQRRLTHTRAVEAFAAFSPDGTRIVFARSRSERDDYELYVMNADGTCERRLTSNAAWDWMPDWTGTGGGRLRC